ncbi:LamB/YcsF family protein [Bordetella genomosp. 12]|uniref:5-oxoprolinase subunit A n=1 Tax=Bordetella genomosp. 12 TaxID=463035 RepID=A0A261VAT3_9BORD|nr:5-oxoprolinase subunit PxpA [Bordetella genomosp. 12]OZI70871.1 hypothetical protein CAL22_13290 [Bordetella genomosp. 12]
MVTVDLNSDIGEGFGDYVLGDDAAILGIVSSANVACGFHAGDPEIMARTFSLARERGVVAGAHPGFPDLWGFGRRKMPFSTGEIERLVAYQIGAAQALSAYAGHPVRYVKPHGALSNMAIADTQIAQAICRAVCAVDASLVYLAPARTHQERCAREAGLITRAEVFADRAYMPDGSLMPRSMPGAVLSDIDAVVARALRMVRGGYIETPDGAQIATPVDSLCVHGDSPAAVDMARALRNRFEHEGIVVRGFV